MKPAGTAPRNSGFRPTSPHCRCRRGRRSAASPPALPGLAFPPTLVFPRLALASLEWEKARARQVGRDNVSMAFIGKSVPRLEDRPLVTGRGAYAADISFPYQLHMRVVRSAVAHGRIIAVETSAARALPGVVAVWTSSDVADIPPIDFRL